MKIKKFNENFEKATQATQELLTAISNKDLENVKKAIKNGADLNYRNPRNVSNTPLISAIYSACDYNIAKELIDAGADLNIGDLHDVTPLMCTIIKSKIEMFDYLLKSKTIDLDKKTDGKKTALILAAGGYGRATTTERNYMIKKLIDAGADMFIQNQAGDFYDNAAEKEIKEFIEKEYPEFIAAKKYNL